MRYIFILMFLACASCTRKKPIDIIETKSLETPPVFDGIVIEKQAEPDTTKKSIKAFVTTTVGEATLSIAYHSPAVKSRIIWGGLVPFDQVWVTGAHMATAFECNQDFVIAEKIIPAGKYGLFTIPSKDQWTFILNKNWQQHLADEYNETEDIIRVVIDTQNSNHQERLRYELVPIDSSSVSISMQWEKIQFSIPVKLK